MGRRRSFTDIPILVSYPTRAHEPRRGRTLDDALAALVAETVARVAEGVRASGTLTMQRQHARFWRRTVGGRLALARVDEELLEHLAGAVRRHGGRDDASLNLRTVQKLFSTLRLALKLARRRRWIARVPSFPVFAFPPFQAKASVFTRGADFWRLFEALPRGRAEWMALCFFTAQHASDVERMSWADVQLRAAPAPGEPERSTMLLRNTKNRRPPFRVAMPAPLATILRARRDRVKPRKTDAIVARWPNRGIMLARACLRIGLPPMNAIALRHAATSAMVRRLGITPAAQRWGGWRSLTMMEQVYAHALPPALDEIATELASFVAREGAEG
jgi:integrase